MIRSEEMWLTLRLMGLRIYTSQVSCPTVQSLRIMRGQRGYERMLRFEGDKWVVRRSIELSNYKEVGRLAITREPLMMLTYELLDVFKEG
jgi:hypothetical protein